MSYFLFEGIVLPSQPFVIEGDEARHILQTRRIRHGETIEIQDMQGLRYLCNVENSDRRTVTLRPKESLVVPSESLLRISLFQALLKEKAMENLIQKTTELGVARIVVMETIRSQRFAPARQHDKQLVRWQRIAQEACKQSGRGKPPEICLGGNFERVFDTGIADSDADNFCLHPEAHEEQTGLQQLSMKNTGIFIGPEGGFDEKELPKTLRRIVLGPRILRGDTAAITAVGILQFLHGDLQNR